MFTPGTRIEPKARRTWYPDAYLDEIMPAGRATPDAWLFQLDDGALRCGCHPDGKEADFQAFAVAEGEVVEFSACDDLGTSVLTVAEDGSYRFDPPPPAGAILWETGDGDTQADSPEEYVQFARDGGYLPEPGEPAEIRVAVWSDTTRLRFTAQDGPPRFVVAEATEVSRG